MFVQFPEFGFMQNFLCGVFGGKHCNTLRDKPENRSEGENQLTYRKGGRPKADKLIYKATASSRPLPDRIRD
jgi:hypothetical protein